jgi:hypothetical protein
MNTCLHVWIAPDAETLTLALRVTYLPFDKDIAIQDQDEQSPCKNANCNNRQGNTRTFFDPFWQL